MRIALFVDGPSMFYAQRENAWHIDWKKVYDCFASNKDLYGAFYFNAKPPRGDPQATRRYAGFRDFLIETGYTVIEKEVKVLTDKLTGQVRLKGSLDIEIVFYMLVGAGGYDEAVLFTGDADYVRVVEYLKSLGKAVVCVGRKPSVSFQLINAASKFVDLEAIRDSIERTG